MKKKALFALITFLMVVFVCLIITEVFSIFLIKKIGWNYEPAYLRILKGYSSANLVGGRTEYHSWGSWNVPRYTGRVANNCFDVQYSFNSYGARDKNRTMTGKDRTLVFGDSFVEGWGVEQDQILAAQLERLTNKEFLNFGVAGSGTAVLNEYILYRDMASKLEHDAVMVGLYPGNDFRDNDPEVWSGLTEVYYRPFWKLNADKTDFEELYFAEKIEGKYLPGLEPENKAPHFTVYNSWEEFFAFVNLRAVLKNQELSLSNDGSKGFAYTLDVSDDAITADLLIHEKFSKLIGNKPKYVFIVPAATDVFYYVNKGKQKVPKFEEFKQKLSEQGWQVIDLMDAFAELPEDEIADYFICDGHWNAKGNEVAAKYLFNVMNSQPVIVEK